MKRKLTGESHRLFPVAGYDCLYVLPFETAFKWELKKDCEAIALCWQGKLHFRKLYFRKGEYCFKFFNHIIYLSEIARTEGTHSYIIV